ncbi:hypothetical protein VEE46_13480 [Escherichia coli]|nr:hypothetical protein VEE46_13480 [Escherichia coli]
MGLLTLMVLSLTAQAQTFQMYTPMGIPSFLAKLVFSLEVVTPAGVYTGTYQSHNPYMLQVGNLDAEFTIQVQQKKKYSSTRI